MDIASTAVTLSNKELHMSTHKFVTGLARVRTLAMTSAMTSLFAFGAVQWAHANPPTITDKDFVQEAFSSAQVEIELSRVAVQQGANARTKKLANTIIKENSDANTKLRALAATRKMNLPAQLDKDQQQRVDQLKQSNPKTFDAAYREQLEQSHEAAIALFDKVAKNPASDAELRVFASQRLPQFKKHEQMLEKIGGSSKVAQR